METKLIIGAAKEFAYLYKELLKEGRFKHRKHLNKFLRKLEDEKIRPDRDNDDILTWTRNVKLFIETVVKEIPTKS